MNLTVSKVRLRSGLSQVPAAPVSAPISGLLVPICQDPASSQQQFTKATADDSTKIAVAGLTLLEADTAGDEIPFVGSGIVELVLSAGVLPKGAVVVLGLNGAIRLYQDILPGEYVVFLGFAVDDNVLQVQIQNWGTVMTNPSPPLAVVLAADVNDAAWGTAGIVEIDGGAANRNVTGMASGVDGFQRWIVNVGATNNIVLKNENAGSVIANRIHETATGADVVLTPGQSAMVYYRAGTLNRWRAFSAVS